MPAAIKGYTLIELLIVVTIMGLLSVSAIVYSRSLSQDQFLLKAIDNIQSLLRSAQGNATSAFSCGSNSGASNWSVAFTGDSNTSFMSLYCGSGATPTLVRSLQLENNIRIDSITGSACSSPAQLPVSVAYSALYGKAQFSGTSSCLTTSTTLTIVLRNTITNGTKSFVLTNGGAINAQ